MDLGIADDAPLPDFALACLELRLDEHERIPARLQERQDRGESEANADEGDVTGEEIGAERELAEVARVRPLHDGDARVVAKLRMQLAVADIDGDHSRNAVLEQVIGEAAGGRADVDAVARVELDLELLEGVRELLAAPRDEARRSVDCELGVVGHLVAGLVVAGHEACEHERLCLRAALRQAALDEQDVESLLHRAQGSRRGCYKTDMELRGDRIVLRPLAEGDVDRIVELGADPEVQRWWRGLTPEYVLEKARGEDKDVAVYAIVVDGEVAGMIQCHEELDDEYRHAGIDLFLGAPYHDRGLGTDAVRTMARHLLQDRGHHRLAIDPAAHNSRAIRCYEKVGFKRVGIMREYWLDPEGAWRDGVLLDLLAKDVL